MPKAAATSNVISLSDQCRRLLYCHLSLSLFSSLSAPSPSHTHNKVTLLHFTFSIQHFYGYFSLTLITEVEPHVFMYFAYLH